MFGETGSGKEVLAQIIGNQAQQSSRNFTAMNCAALPEKLLASELFGHVKGAFTDASETRQGVLQQNAGGVVFLDEINKASPGLQGMLLRYMETGDFKPVGADIPVRPLKPVRIIAAANEAPGSSSILQDFRHRFTYEVHIPPLRERPGDIPWLLSQRGFLGEERIYTAITLRTLLGLMFNQWHGNIRELKTYCQRKLIIAQSAAPQYPAHVLDDTELISDEVYAEWSEFARLALSAIGCASSEGVASHSVAPELLSLLIVIACNNQPARPPWVPLPIIPIRKLEAIVHRDASNGERSWRQVLNGKATTGNFESLIDLGCAFNRVAFLRKNRMTEQFMANLIGAQPDRRDQPPRLRRLADTQPVRARPLSELLKQFEDRQIAFDLFSDPGPPMRDFHSILDSLSLLDKDRQICELCHEGCTYQQIKDTTGIPKATAQEKIAKICADNPELGQYLHRRKPGRPRKTMTARSPA